MKARLHAMAGALVLITTACGGVLPPRPNNSDAAPPTTRRCNSFMCGNTRSKNRASPSAVTSTPTRHYARTNLAWTLTASFSAIKY